MKISKMLLAGAACGMVAGAAFAQDAEDPAVRRAKSEVTEIWEPVPALVATPEGQPPSDAVVLFDNFGQTTILFFSGFQKNPSVPASTFVFTPPAVEPDVPPININTMVKTRLA